eukprot:CAMPEP_0205816670 /NCGR_PEP_ID=MMETSP0205-20121125/23145_1 /ASSEMBLY_ACC=CAM_ASM_000278 /TAXON_ID=36767 /ORGANISM="Euplotes focardii, Strain TN1" /LENGTH=38 /DNA_ID= /DNA_START= /DNA_END= /DNA_ORIENTATION=
MRHTKNLWRLKRMNVPFDSMTSFTGLKLLVAINIEQTE